MKEEVYDYTSNNICIVEAENPSIRKTSIDCNQYKCLCTICKDNTPGTCSNKCMLSDHLYITNKIKYTTDDKEKFINIININLANASPIPPNNVKCSDDEFENIFEYLLSPISTGTLFNNIQKNEVYDIICCQEFDLGNTEQLTILYDLCEKYNYYFFIGQIYNNVLANGLVTLISGEFMKIHKFDFDLDLLDTYRLTEYEHIGIDIFSMEIINDNLEYPPTFGNILLTNTKDNITLIIYNCKYKVFGATITNISRVPLNESQLASIKWNHQWNLYTSSKIIEHSYNQIYNTHKIGKTIIIISGDFNYRDYLIKKYIYPNIKEYYDYNIQSIFDKSIINIDFDYYIKLIKFYNNSKYNTENNDIIKLNNDYIIPFVINDRSFKKHWYSMSMYTKNTSVSQETSLYWYYERQQSLKTFMTPYPTQYSVPFQQQYWNNKYIKIKKKYLLLKNSLK